MTVRSGKAKQPEPAKPQPAAPLPRLRLPGVSDTADDAAQDGNQNRRNGRGDAGMRAKDRRGGAARDQRKFVPRRGGG